MPETFHFPKQWTFLTYVNYFSFITAPIRLILQWIFLVMFIYKLYCYIFEKEDILEKKYYVTWKKMFILFLLSLRIAIGSSYMREVNGVITQNDFYSL